MTVKLMERCFRFEGTGYFQDEISVSFRNDPSPYIRLRLRRSARVKCVADMNAAEARELSRALTEAAELKEAYSPKPDAGKDAPK